MIQIIQELEKVMGSQGELVPRPQKDSSETRQPCPETDFDREEFLAHFADRLPAYAQALGLTAEEVASVRSDAASFRWAVDMHERAKEVIRDWMVFKKRLRDGSEEKAFRIPPEPAFPGRPETSLLPGVFWRVRCLIRRIKNDHAYSDEIGRDLGIVGCEWMDDLISTKPLITAQRGTHGYVEITWHACRSERVTIEVDRNDSGFVFLGVATGDRFIDVQPVPAARMMWKYRAMCGCGEERTGAWSECVTFRTGL